MIGTTEKLLYGILLLGLSGLMILLVFGNLSGNLGFKQDSVTITNETNGFINETGYTLAGAVDRGAKNFNIVSIVNATNDDGTLVSSAIYSVSNVGVVTNATSGTNSTYANVNITYTYTRDSASIIATEDTIGNITSGTNTFFGFSPTFMTLVAVSLLIGIVLVVIKLVRSKSGSSGDGTGFTG